MTGAISSGVVSRTLQFTGTGVFNPDTLAAAHRLLDEVEADPAVECLYLTGEDKNFSQGLDLDYLMANLDVFPQFVVDTMRLAARLLTFPVPVVSIVNGHAFGLGAMLVLASDYAVMRSDRGFFCLPEINIGMTLAVRMNALVTNRMNTKAVRDTLLTGARIDAARALELNIVDGIGSIEQLPALAEAVSEPMRGKPRHLLAGLKYGASQTLVDLILSDVDDGPIEALQAKW